jgi:hypothetical protein
MCASSYQIYSERSSRDTGALDTGEGHTLYWERTTFPEPAEGLG